VGLDRPDQVLANVYPANWGPGLPQYLNAAAFAQNATGTFGDIGRNSVYAPGTFEFDAALSRIFSITERWRLEARAEGFNVINHTNFDAPSSSNQAISSSNFGRITSTQSVGPQQQGAYRILQFALKLYF
jgi:hypothetical protein